MSPTAFGEKIKGVAVFLSGKYPQTDINNGRVTKDMLVMAASQEYDIDEDKATEVVNTLVDVGIVELTDDRVKTLLGVEVGFSDYMEPSRKGPVYGIPRLDGSIRHVDGYGNPIQKENKMKITKEQLKKIIKEELEESNLFQNIRAKRARGETPAKKGDKGYPDEKSWKKATMDEGEYYVDALDENEEYCPDCAEMEEAKKKKACKPSKGKRFAKRVDGKCRSYGQAGQAKGGGDRIRPGTKKGDAYCARSAGIKKCKNPPCANTLSRKKWKCRGKKSMKS